MIASACKGYRISVRLISRWSSPTCGLRVGFFSRFSMLPLSASPVDSDFIVDESSRKMTKATIRGPRVRELREELATRGLDSTGNRPELVARLLDSGIECTREHFAEFIDSSYLSGHHQIAVHDSLQLDATRTYALRFRGRSNPSRGIAGMGIVLCDAETNSAIWTSQGFLDGMTLFQAEYNGIMLGLDFARRHGAKKLTLQTDNDVIIRQLNGHYVIKNEGLHRLYWASFKIMEESFSSVKVEAISEKENKEAIHLAAKALGSKRSCDLVVEHIKNDVLSTSGLPEIHSDKTYLLKVDGGARRNPGYAGAGVVLYDHNGTPNEIWCGWQCLHNVTNNVAEYWSLILGLRCARTLGIENLVVESDSLLVVRQVNGEYKVKQSKLKEMHRLTVEEVNKFHSIKVSHIPREENKRADELANHAMDTISSHALVGCDNLLDDVFTTGNDEQGVAKGSMESQIPGFAQNVEQKEGNVTEELVSKDLKPNVSPDDTFVLRVDGGSRGNPGGSGAGMVIFCSDGEEIWCGRKFLGLATNNVAEYWSWILGLRKARSLGIKKLKIESDSKLVVSQVKGEYKVRDSGLKPLHRNVMKELESFTSFDVNHIMRKENRRADELANQSMDAKDSLGLDS